MKTRTLLITMTALFAAVPTVIWPPQADSSTEKVLHTFTGASDGSNPIGGLTADQAGNLYGTTQSGGELGNGVVYELIPASDGTWTEVVLHTFSFDGVDGILPSSALVFDAAGNLYGTTVQGGAYDGGTVFELNPGANGTWTERILHSFDPNANDGFNPYSGLTLDAAGNLYGTTYYGPGLGFGTAYQLRKAADGSWAYKVIYTFYSHGYRVFAGLIVDGAGNFYGTTQYGGIKYGGTVYELVANSNGTWTEKVLRAFGCYREGGCEPYGGLVMNAAGKLYGTTMYGGIANQGVVFELTPLSGGTWKENVLHNFQTSQDGMVPYSTPVLDSKNNVYGTTSQSVVNRVTGAGIVFELSNVSGTWQETILHNFSALPDAETPYSGLTRDKSGNFFGTSYFGGIGYGAVYEITP